MKETNKHNTLKSLIEVLPNKPGVYQYLDKEGKLLYVGKARDLKKRVSSYFSKAKPQNFKQHVLVNKIHDIRHIVVSTESDALLLENNLIKKHQPRYNVLLKDDKTFPWICIKNEPFPRVFKTRKRLKDGSVYFGPYTSVFMIKTILEVARQLFPLRNCNLKLEKENIEKGKFKVCLEYHLGNCMAPCVGKQTEMQYMDSIEQVSNILKGEIRKVAEHLRRRMEKHAGAFAFEEAQKLKEKIEILEKYRSKSTIVNPRINNADVFSIVEDNGYAYVNCLRVIEGAIVQAHTLEIRKKMDESREELLALAIVDIRRKTESDAKEIIVPQRIGLPLEGVRFIVPQKGDKMQLLKLSEKNAAMYRVEKTRRLEIVKKQTGYQRILESIQKDLRLKHLPEHMECFDNSNLSGAYPVAACVVFRNAKPSAKEYRHYHVKTVRGTDDYASVREIINRRYKRMIQEKQALPQLVIIDGGKGQLNAAVGSLDDLGLRGKVAVIGIAKRLEEIYFPEDKVPLYIDKNSETLKVILQIRNEAHRFGIKFHRGEREKSMLRSGLDSIKGIGEKSREALMINFHSFEQIKKADEKELTKVVGKSRARIIKDHFLRSTT